MARTILVHLNVTLHAADDTETAQDVAEIVSDALASDETASALDIGIALAEEV